MLANNIKGSLHSFTLNLADAMGSGDDDEDGGQEDSVTETENDQVYFSRGVCRVYRSAKIKCHRHICQENRLKLGSMILLVRQAHTGPMFREWRKSFTLSPPETQLNSAVRLQGAHCLQSAG